MFEGSYLGDDERLDASDRLECGICWWVYDPEQGDPSTHVPPGTPFTSLAGQWRCPNCDAPKYKFMVLPE
ncbi:MAG: rubredoxin [Polyangiaceae bacterium]|nr:rubredoxin [Polyangiaceae bacterium]